jgi:large subunit ribosomal protein L2
MGKRIISQARGKGSSTYRVRRKAFKYRLAYPKLTDGEAKVIKLISSASHTAPLAKMLIQNEIFFIPAFKGMIEGQNIVFGNDVKDGNVLRLQDIPIGVNIFNIESRPLDGGKFMKTAGSSAMISKKSKDKVVIAFPSKKEKELNGDCRATIGVVAGSGRKEKPFVNAGRKFHLMKSRGKLWPRTSALKMNAIDHPFGSGRGKNPKSKIAKRNAPAGLRVGHIRPRRTGRTKR